MACTTTNGRNLVTSPMIKDDTFQEDELELETVTDESTDEDIFSDEDESHEDDTNDIVKQKDAQIAKLKAILARKTRKLESSSRPITQTNQVPDELFKEEVTLLAQGYSKDLLEQAKVYANGAKTSLSDALSSPALVALKQKEDATKKRQAASTGASKSPPAYVEQKFSTGMSQEDHKKAWAERMGQ